MKQIVEHARDGESHETLLPDNMKPFGEIGNTEAVVVEEADPLFSKAISLDVDEDTGDKTLTMLGKIQCRNSKSRGEDSFSVGFNTVAENDQELAAGRYNFSHKGSESWGDPGNTIHSIGIGTEESNRTNAVEVMQDGKVYVIGAGGYDGKTLEGASDLATILNGIPEQLADYVNTLPDVTLHTLLCRLGVESKPVDDMRHQSGRNESQRMLMSYLGSITRQQVRILNGHSPIDSGIEWDRGNAHHATASLAIVLRSLATIDVIQRRHASNTRSTSCIQFRNTANPAFLILR